MVRFNVKYKWLTDRERFSSHEYWSKKLYYDLGQIDEYFRTAFHYMGPNWKLAKKKYPLSPFVFRDQVRSTKILEIISKLNNADSSWKKDYEEVRGTDARGTQHSGTCCEREKGYDHPPIYKTSL